MKKRVREEGLRMVLDLRLVLQGSAWKLHIGVLGGAGFMVLESDVRYKETDISVWRERRVQSLTGKAREIEKRSRIHLKFRFLGDQRGREREKLRAEEEGR